MKLYGFPPSPNTWKVRAVAAHFGLALDLEVVDLAKGEQRAPAFLALNPAGRTPVLVDGDFVLSESTAIMHYLASQNANPLWPDDIRLRADILRWQSWQLAHWGRACEILTFERLVKQVLGMGPPDPARLAEGTEAFHREAPVLDARLAEGPYLVGAAPTLADFSVAASAAYAKEIQLPLDRYPRIGDWLARVLALPAWRDTAPVRPSAAA